VHMHEPGVGIAMLEESVRVARDAGIFSALSISLPFLAGVLPIEESERALALLDEAIEVGTLDGWKVWGGEPQLMLTKATIALQRGDWRTALQESVNYFESDDATAVAGPFYVAGSALCRLGCFEPAAVLLGKADVMFARSGPDWFLALLAATDAALLETLGEQRASALAARGAALEYADAAAYVRAEAELVLQQT